MQIESYFLALIILLLLGTMIDTYCPFFDYGDPNMPCNNKLFIYLTIWFIWLNILVLFLLKWKIMKL